MCVYYIHKYKCLHVDTLLAERCGASRMESLAKPCPPSTSDSRTTWVSIASDCEACEVKRLRDLEEKELAAINGSDDEYSLDETSSNRTAREWSPDIATTFVMDGFEDRVRSPRQIAHMASDRPSETHKTGRASANDRRQQEMVPKSADSPMSTSSRSRPTSSRSTVVPGSRGRQGSDPIPIPGAAERLAKMSQMVEPTLPRMKDGRR